MLRPLNPHAIQLAPSLFQQRQALNLKYLSSLDSTNLLRPYLHEAGLWSYSGNVGTTISDTTSDGPETWHWGWESLTCDLRGHFLGHWLSSAAHGSVQTQNIELKAKMDAIVSRLANCQKSHGDGWCGPFPQRFMTLLAQGKARWAPQYVLHKILAGLFDAWQIAGNEQAGEILLAFANWFDKWTSEISDDDWTRVLEAETGGMLEVWANLFGVTGDEKHRALIGRYYRHSLFDGLLAGDDVLTNKHANTQIPEILGAARAWEVTGDDRYRRVVEAFWEAAIARRGCYCTGGSSCGEVWTPPFELSARLDKPHEHCTVYNLMRLADALFRWTGDKTYADYWERNYLNAILAQQNSETGMVSYFLPLGGQSKKKWGRALHDFWCCHGTLLQAHAHPQDSIFFEDENGLVLSQFVPCQTTWRGAKITLAPEVLTGTTIGRGFSRIGHDSIQNPAASIPARRPYAFVYELHIETPTPFVLCVRVPDWLAGPLQILQNGEPIVVPVENGFARLDCAQNTAFQFVLPKKLTAEPLPDAPHMFAFLDGPLVLAGLVEEERTLRSDPENPTQILIPDAERFHGWWHTGTYHTRGQERNFRFVPLHEVRDEIYCVYFPLEKTER